VDQSGASISIGARQSVIVGHQPDGVVIDRETFHDACRIASAIAQRILYFAIVIFGENLVSCRIGFEDYSVMAAQHK